MPTRVGTHAAKTNLSEYLNRAAYGGERIVVERHGKPVAALIGMEDLRRLEALDVGAPAAGDDADRQAAFRRQLQEAGVVVSWPAGTPIPREERKPLRIEGRPVSEQILEERR